MTKISNEKITIFIVSLALFMNALDTTIVNTAIPAIARSLQVNAVDLKIALITYLLSLALFIPISGWLADKFGMKRIFILALTIFILSSLWCGYAQTLFELGVARSIQGLGGALVLPLSSLIILRTFKRHQIINAMNTIIMIAAIGQVLGPLVGGVITEHLSWRWIFWVNIPIGILTIVMAVNWLQEAPKHTVRPFDILGFILFSGGLATLTFSLSEMSAPNVQQIKIIMAIGVSLLMLIAYFLRSNTQFHPIIDMKLFQLRTFRISVFGNLLTRLGFGGLQFLLPLLLQIGLGYSAQFSGLLVMPIALGILFIKPLTLYILRILGYKKLLLINTVLISFSLWTFQLINIHTSAFVIVDLGFIFGFFISLQNSGIHSLSYAEISLHEQSNVASIVTTSQQLSQTFSVAVAAFFLQYFSLIKTGSSVLTTNVFYQTFFSMGILTLCSSIIFLFLKKNDGYQMLANPDLQTTESKK